MCQAEHNGVTIVLEQEAPNYILLALIFLLDMKNNRKSFSCLKTFNYMLVKNLLLFDEWARYYLIENINSLFLSCHSSSGIF